MPTPDKRRNEFSPGYRCPTCRENKTLVIDSRPTERGHVRRRRYCEKCMSKFTTMEVSIDLIPSFDVNSLAARAAEATAEALKQVRALTLAVKAASYRKVEPL